MTALRDPCTSVRAKQVRRLRAIAVKLARGDEKEKALAASLHEAVEQFKVKEKAGRTDRKPPQQGIPTTNTVQIGRPAQPAEEE